MCRCVGTVVGVEVGSVAVVGWSGIWRAIAWSEAGINNCMDSIEFRVEERVDEACGLFENVDMRLYVGHVGAVLVLEWWHA